jgi:TAG lipase / steryl ester hydrolase / phospholipase A2 / LPA acyltransferase
MNVSIAPAETHQTSRLLNATTSPSMLMRSAVMASAAVPGIFPPVTLQALDSDGQRKSYLPSRRWVDGSVSDDMPAKRLARLYGVNHYIVSQINPHVLPFVTDGHRKQSSIGLLETAGRRATREWFNAITLILDRADKKNGPVSQATSLMRSIINQDYVGDINILPDYRLINPTKLLGFPGEKQVKKLIASGERRTWPKLEMIRQQTRVSRTLRQILQNYKVDVVV